MTRAQVLETDEQVSAWFAGRVPDDWFGGPPEVTLDREEILVVGSLPDVQLAADASEAVAAQAREARIEGWREDTREQRMRIADEAQRRFHRKVSWGAECGGERRLFTTLSMPVMTRLRMKDREVLDTLVESGVARSRSHALAWCVRLVGDNQAEWIGKLKDALVHVESARAEGPTPSR
jgi:hypothetical protein